MKSLSEDKKKSIICLRDKGLSLRLNCTEMSYDSCKNKKKVC